MEEAKKVASAKIDELQTQLRSCLNALERIKANNQPATPVTPVADSVADEIAANLQALVGTTEETAPKAEPRHPINDTTTSKFANLQFGRNYQK